MNRFHINGKKLEGTVRVSLTPTTDKKCKTQKPSRGMRAAYSSNETKYGRNIRERNQQRAKFYSKHATEFPDRFYEPQMGSVMDPLLVPQIDEDYYYTPPVYSYIPVPEINHDALSCIILGSVVCQFVLYLWLIFGNELLKLYHLYLRLHHLMCYYFARYANPNVKFWLGNVHIRRVFVKVDEEVEDEEEKDEYVVPEDLTEFVDLFKSLGSVLTSYKELAGTERKIVIDRIFREMEGALLLYVSLRKCEDTSAILSTLGLYARGWSNKSFSGMMEEYLAKLFLTTPQASGIDYDVIKDSEWKNLLFNLKTNWKLVKENKFFGHLSKALGLVVFMGLCDAKQATFTIKDYTICQPDLQYLHENAIDVVDAVLSTSTYFIETFMACITRKSLKPIFFDNPDVLNIDTKYAQMLAKYDLIRQGNLTRIDTIGEETFYQDLESLASQINAMKMTTTGIAASLLGAKHLKLVQMIYDYTSFRVNGELREAPFALELFGASSVGKTTAGNQIVDFLLNSAGQNKDPQYRGVYNSGDRFMSNWESNKTVMTIDDFANDKNKNPQIPPTRILIDVINNQTMYANKASVEDKGRVVVAPRIVIVNTNVKNLSAGVHSQCPYAIQRRMNYVLTVHLRDEFKDASGGVDPDKVVAVEKAAIAGGKILTYDDIWLFDVDIAVRPEEMSHVASYISVVHKGKELKSIGFPELMNFLTDRYAAHLQNQVHLLQKARDRTVVLPKCTWPGCNQLECICLEHNGFKYVEKQGSGDFLAASALSMGTRALARIMAGGDRLERNFVESVLTRADAHIARWDFVAFLPRKWVRNEYFVMLMMGLEEHKIRRFIVKWFFQIALYWYKLYFKYIGSFFVFNHFIYNIMDGGIFVLGLIALTGFVAARLIFEGVRLYYYFEDFYIEQLMRRNCISRTLQWWREHVLSRVITVGAVFATVLFMRKVYRLNNASKCIKQGNLEPKTQEDIDKRDSEVNVWQCAVVKQPLPVNPLVPTTTSEQAENNILKNLMSVSIIHDGRTFTVNCLFLTSNFMLIPKHLFEVADEIEGSVSRMTPHCTGCRIRVLFSSQVAYFIPNSDLAVMYTPTGGSFGNITDLFIDNHISGHDFRLLYRKPEGVMLKDKYGNPIRSVCRYKPDVTNDCMKAYCTFEGYEYELPIETFRGLCGAIVLANTRPVIAGIHLGGVSGQKYGVAGCVYRRDIVDALRELSRLNGVVPTAASGKFENQMYGVTSLFDQRLHEKSPINYLSKGSSLVYRGSDNKLVSFKSRVRKTVISDTITEVMGFPYKYIGPTVRPSYLPWQSCLNSMAFPGRSFSFSVLELAVHDYKSALLPIFADRKWVDTTPLNDHDNINGIPGKKFIDAIKASTSIGFPLTGPKSDHMVNMDPGEDNYLHREFTPEIMAEIARCVECYKKGLRAYPVARGCIKDEVHTKEKARVFFINSVAFTFLLRRYFLPIMRILQMYPFISECAVGINCHGPEWEQLHHYVRRHGIDQMIGGDYSKYDQKLPAQILLAGLHCLISFAKVCNYSFEDIKIMEAMCGDLIYPMVLMNGDLVECVEGSHISGNSLTTVLNGIAGSLNMRCAFYDANNCVSMMDYISFRDLVAFLTYGDDNMGSADAKSRLTILVASIYLSKHGQTYTMPDKESELQDYLPPTKIEFLKRKSVFHEKLGLHLGALDQNSCAKMLHAHIREEKAPLSEEMAAAQNIDTALQEWFNHGPVIYEERREQLRQVAERCGLTSMCGQLDLSYDDRVIKWFDTYHDQLVPDSVPWNLAQSALDLVVSINQPTTC